MRTLSLAAFAAVILTLTGGNPARADGSWCAEYYGRGGTNCGFTTTDNVRPRSPALAGSAVRIPG
jgi:hypothetical protein